MWALVLLLCMTAAAAAGTAAAQSREGPPVRHVTDVLTAQMPDRAAMRAMADRWRTEGLPRAKTAATYEPGAVEVFKVRDLTRTDGDSRLPLFFEIPFTLTAVEDQFRLWVETAELENEHVREQDLQALIAALSTTTPPGSINADAGIIANDEVLFGQPPDVNGDGKVDVLLTDIKEGREAGQAFVAGFVDPLDVFTDAANERDILYLDTQPGLFGDTGQYRGTEGIQETAAHEYQHLIHLRYDPTEITFVNEGLSEWAALANGYVPRAITYFRNPARYDVSLFRWSVGLTTDVLDDYQRAGLFTAYLAERIGPLATGAITRQVRQSYDGYRAVLVPLGHTVEAMVRDFHVANLLNDPDVAPAYRYATEPYQDLHLEPVRAEQSDPATPYSEVSVRSGGARYLSWHDVVDFTLLIDIVVNDESDAASLIARRERAGLVAVLYRDGAVVGIEPFVPSLDARVFPGAYDRIDLVVANKDPRPREIEDPGGLHLFYEATWEPVSGVAAEAPPEAPAQLTLEAAYPNPFATATTLPYALPTPGPVRVAVFDVLGRQVRTLVDQVQAPGRYAVQWDGRDGAGAAVAPGTYLVRLTTAGAMQTRRLVVVR